MDNASKALIMAGAILIAIAIVGVGVYIFSSTSSITNTGRAQIDAAAAQMANSNLRQYAGRVRGSSVKDLLSYAGTLNAQQVYPKDLTLNGSTAIAINQDLSGYNDNAFYTVTLSDTDQDGYYDNIGIAAATAGATE